MNVELASILDSLGPARRFADPATPREGRLLAARGVLPLPPGLIASVLFALHLDPDEEVSARATQSLAELPGRVLDPALDAALPAALLHWFAERWRDDAGRVEKIALNPAVDDETLAFLATLPYPRVIEIIAGNQTRLLRCPQLVDALGENSLTPQSSIERILQFLRVEAGPAPDAEKKADAASDEPREPLAPEVLAAEVPPELVEEPGQASPEEEEDRSRNLYTLIQGFNVMQRIKLALFGNGEARGLLVRDRNRVVASAVLRSPKLSDKEVASFARSRAVADDVIRQIAANRQWTGVYAVQLALAQNPKTPVPTAVKFLNYLTDRDLKQIMRSRDVVGQVSTQARRILSRKGQA